eukprot:514875-Alexandrium_andersonii.AAC.1
MICLGPEAGPALETGGPCLPLAARPGLALPRPGPTHRRPPRNTPLRPAECASPARRGSASC